MVSITLSVPKDMKIEMESFQEINWSEVARQAIRKKLQMLEKFREFTEQSTISDKDALEFGAKVSKRALDKTKAK